MLTDNQIIELSDGNMGALRFLSMLIFRNKPTHRIIVKKILELKLKGTDIYVLFSDLCFQDLDEVYNIVNKVPADKLIIACAQQDRSGVQMIKDYYRKCRECGCTAIDCKKCVEKTGSPCHWIEVDLCSACKI